MNLFKKKNYINLPSVSQNKKSNESVPTVPDGLWIKCPKCGKIIYKKEIGSLKICPKCGGYFRMSAKERLELIIDEYTFIEFDENLTPENPMNYPEYDKIIKKAQEKSGLKEGAICGRGRIGGFDTVICIMDSNFMMGSMGSVVGEKITRAVEKATELKLPIIIFTASGGARMQEGIISLMQMAKTSAALKRHSDEGLLYITVLTDPTTGGVSASFGMLGDIIIAEPGALIGFAGKRVIESTINQKLPDGFQSAEFQLKHGFVDKIVKRENLKFTLSKILELHINKGGW